MNIMMKALLIAEWITAGKIDMHGRLALNQALVNKERRCGVHANPNNRVARTERLRHWIAGYLFVRPRSGQLPNLQRTSNTIRAST